MSLFYQVLELYPRGLKGEGWVMRDLCENPNLPMDFVANHLEGVYSMNDQGELVLTECDWYQFSDNFDLDWNLVREHPEPLWNWDILSHQEYSDRELIRDNLDKPWNWGLLSIRHNLNWIWLENIQNSRGAGII